MRPSSLVVSGLALGSLLLTGCVKEVPIVSDPAVTTNETLEEQWAWVEQELDRSIAESGVVGGWYKPFESGNVPWDADPGNRENVIKSLLPQGCGMGGQLVVLLRNDGIEEPLAVAEQVRAFWDSEGWVLSDINSYDSVEYPYFRADLPDGASLAFDVNEVAVTLEVATSCSVNNTVTHWEDYLGVPNTFQDELEIREQEDE